MNLVPDRSFLIIRAVVVARQLHSYPRCELELGAVLWRVTDLLFVQIHKFAVSFFEPLILVSGDACSLDCSVAVFQCAQL